MFERVSENIGGPLEITLLRMPGVCRVEWKQEMVVQTQGERMHAWMLGVLMIIGAILVYYLSNSIVLLAVAAVWLGTFVRFYIKLGQSPSMREWQEKPITHRIEARAMVFGMSGGGEPEFSSGFVSPDWNVCGHSGSMPLEALRAFEAGRYNKWFGNNFDRKATQWYEAIIVRVPAKGPRCVAVHAGPPADLELLHEILTREFIAHRANLLKAGVDIHALMNLEVGSPEFMRAFGAAEDDSDNDDVPTKL